jgi:hypothetical protein
MKRIILGIDILFKFLLDESLLSQLLTDIGNDIDMTKLVVTVQNYTMDVISIKEVDVKCKIPTIWDI